MQTDLPRLPASVDEALRRPYGLLRTAAVLALLALGRGLFAAAMWCADVADELTRRR